LRRGKISKQRGVNIINNPHREKSPRHLHLEAGRQNNPINFQKKMKRKIRFHLHKEGEKESFYRRKRDQHLYTHAEKKKKGNVKYIRTGKNKRKRKKDQEKGGLSAQRCLH